MSLAAVAGRHGGPARTGPACRPRVEAAYVEATLGVALALLWAYANTFGGLDGDARIYVGRALADLQPAVARDPIFAHDGQSAFSIYRAFVVLLASRVGFGPAVALLSLLDMAVWFAAAACVATRIARGPAVALVIAAVCVLPRSYAPWHMLSAGEMIAVPRPLAEACVLFAFAATLSGRRFLAAGSLGLGALLHPIMALPGIAALVFASGLRDRRWIVAGTLVVAALGLAALAGAPLAARALAPLDPLWRGVLRERNAYLFPDLWPARTYAVAIVQIVTIAVGASFMASPARRLVGACVVVGLVGLGASWVCGSLLGSLLVVQAQLWRAMWLPAVLAPMAAGLCLWHLPARGIAGHLTLAALAVAWFGFSDPAPAAGAAGLALAVHLAPRFVDRAVHPRLLVWIWASCAVLLAISVAESLHALAIVDGQVPPHHLTAVWPLIWRMGLPAVPVLLGVSAVCRRPWSPATGPVLALFVVAGLAALPFVWDVRTSAQRARDGALAQAELVDRLASRPGAVLWLGSDDVWWWAHRANWNGLTQGAATVFSRDLALLWRLRAQAMIEHGLARPDILDPWRSVATLEPLSLHAGAVADFCARADAPAWIVVPLEPGQAIPKLAQAEVLRGPADDLQLKVGGAGFRWIVHDRHLLVPCGG